jgi:N-acetylmuramoyl-L-alanine amidase
MVEKNKFFVVKSLGFLAVLLVGSLLLSPYRASAATAQDLVTRYTNATTDPSQKIKVLIVPGHDDDYWGTEFKQTREADVVVAIGQYLHDYLKNDPRLDVQITRTQMGYTDTFKNYFTSNRQAIQDFITHSRSSFSQKVASGQIQQVESVPHNTANTEVAIRLFGINKWVNENNIDIVIHLHINDAGGRPWNKAGRYEGVSIYIPESQFPNAPVSAAVGKAIFDELTKYNPISNYPPESAGLLPDQDLIAIGGAHSLNSAASALIEYGYIYEEQYENLDMREILVKDLAYQTFLGLHGFFGDRSTVISKHGTPLLPYTFSKDLKKGLQNNADVLALQAALRKEGVFPAVGNTKYDCTLTGIFGPCTEKAVKAFQKKYGLSQVGNVGPQTRAKLNALYSK